MSLQKIDTGIASTEFCQLPGGMGGKLKMPRLHELYEKLFGTDFEDAHDAAYDVDATAKSFFGLLQRKVVETVDGTIAAEILYEAPKLDAGNSTKRTKAKGVDYSEANEIELTDKPFYHLHVHSQYSVLQAVPDVAELIAKAKASQMDAIANGPWKARFYKSLGCGDAPESRNVSSRQQTVFGKELWKQMMDLFEDEIDASVFSLEFLTYTFLRVMAAVFIIPLWIILGAFTVGWLWPPQVREGIFTSSVLAHSSESEKEDELRITQVAKLQQEVAAFKEDMLQELAMDRTNVVQMKSQVAERKSEIANEMKHIKRLVTILFENQSSMAWLGQ